MNEIAHLYTIPAIFCYENGRRKNPYIGKISNVTERNNQVRVQYELIPTPEWLTYQLIQNNPFAFDITHEWELTRTHWAVKDVDLALEFNQLGFEMPRMDIPAIVPPNLDEHVFDVAFSFAGTNRELVEEIANSVSGQLGGNAVFYDNYFAEFLARPNLDNLLQGIYRARSRLVVVFLGQEYNDRTWTQIEWRAIRQIIAERHDRDLMFIRAAEGEVEGVMPTDGYLDVANFSATQLAQMIINRVTHNKQFRGE